MSLAPWFAAIVIKFSASLRFDLMSGPDAICIPAIFIISLFINLAFVVFILDLIAIIIFYHLISF